MKKNQRIKERTYEYEYLKVLSRANDLNKQLRAKTYEAERGFY